MERNVKVYRIHLAISWLYLLCIALFALIAIVSDNVTIVSIVFPLALFTAAFMAHHFTAKGAKESKPWARASSIIISVLLLCGFPVGTLIGIYLLSNTWRAWDVKPSSGAVAA